MKLHSSYYINYGSNCDFFPLSLNRREDMLLMQQKKKHRLMFLFFVWMQQLPIFPCRRQQSIFGASELNFCVRYENRWDLTANVTAMVYIQALA